MTDSHFSQNPWNSADIIRGYKPDFTPRVAFILGSGLGALSVDSSPGAVGVVRTQANELTDLRAQDPLYQI